MAERNGEINLFFPTLYIKNETINEAKAAFKSSKPLKFDCL